MANQVPRIFACILATSVFLVSTPAVMAQIGPADDTPPDLRDRIIRGELLTPYIKTRSVIDLPRGVDEAEYLLETNRGKPFNVVQTDRQQIVRRTDGGIVIKVRRKKPRNVIIPFPVPGITQHLESTPMLDHDNADIYEKAREITEGETFAFAAVNKLHDWIYNNIRTRENHAAPTPASRTLTRGTGDPAEKAILLAAMSRSLGIPARIAAGVEYQALGNTGLGSFEYHTWTEVFTDEWVPVDPSYADPMADATHIKLGDTGLNTRQDEARLANLIFNQMDGLDIEVLRAQASGSTEISLTGRQADQAIAIPKIDIASFDIQKQSNRDIRQFTVTEEDTVLSLKTPENLFTYGMEQLLAGDPEKARSTFEKVSSQLSTAVEHYSLGEKLASLGFYSQAQREFEAAVRQDPTLKVNVNNWYREFFPKTRLSPEIETAYAEASNLALVGSDLAEEKFQELLGRSPDFTLPYLQLGQLYLSQGNGDSAESAFSRFAESNPDDPRGYQGLGSVYMERGQYAKAREQFKKAEILAGAWHTAQAQALKNEIGLHLKIADSQAQLAANPKNAHAWVTFGQALQEQGRLADAAAAFENALIHQPGNPEALLNQYKLYLDRSEWMEADSLADKVSPGNFRSAENRALAYRVQGQHRFRLREYDEALRSLESAVAIRPEDTESYLLMADIHRRNGHFDQAANILTRGLRQVRHLDDKNRIRQELASRLLFRNPDEARTILNELVMDDPANPETYHKLGQIALASDDMMEARTRMFQAYLLNPYNPDILTDLGTLYLKEDNLGDAVASYQKALKIDPVNARAASRLSEVIEEYDFRIDRPERYLTLNADEQDYIVNIFSILRKSWISERDLLKELNQILTGTFEELKMQAVYERYDTIPILDDYYATQKRMYEHLKGMNPPGRFNQLHYNFAMAYYYNTKYADRLRVAVPLVHTPTTVKEFEVKLKEYHDAARIHELALAGELEKLQGALDHSTQKKIELQSGLTSEIMGIMQEVQSLEEQLVRKLNPNAKTGGSPAAATTPAGPAKSKAGSGGKRGWDDMSEDEKKKFIENLKNKQDVKSVTAERRSPR